MTSYFIRIINIQLSYQYLLINYFWCSADHIDVVKVLLKAGASVHFGTDEGLTPLHLAAEQGERICFHNLCKP